MEEIYTTAEAANKVGATRRTITDWIKSGRLRADPAPRGVGRGPGRGWRIKYTDLLAAVKGTQWDVIEATSIPMMLNDPDSRSRDSTSLLVRWPLEQRVEPFTLDLLCEDYTRLRAVTYTVSIPMIDRLLRTANYEEFQVIFGSEKLVTAGARAIFNFQYALEEEMNRGFVAAAGLDDPRTQALMAHVAEGRGEFRAMKDKVAHSKIYLLDGDGRRRVILGSANLSETAFSGRQGEVMLAFDDDEFMWEQIEGTYLDLYDHASNTVPLTTEARPAEIVPIDQLALFLAVTKRQAPVPLYVPASDDDAPGSVEQIAVLMDRMNTRMSLAVNGTLAVSNMGDAKLTPGIVKQMTRTAAAARPPFDHLAIGSTTVRADSCSMGKSSNGL